MKIGILDIQGSVEEHFSALSRLEVEAILVKKNEDLSDLSGLIIPGGESTTLGKLLRKFKLRDAIIDRVREGMAVWGTCAGAILLAKEVVGEEQADTLGLMNIVIERNAYGRQLDSFEGEVSFAGKRKVEAIFIRAPKIVRIGEGVEVLARNGDEIVAAREGKIMVTTFHPELTSDLSVHKYFVGIVK
jgi:pyridoxal 5'-phosphate synthase pdxT subunit